MERTIFWDKLRTTHFEPPATLRISIRIEPCVAVIKQVTGRSFSVPRIYQAIKECEWAEKGHALFYNTALSPWPISKQLVDPTTGVFSTVPLPEADLARDTLMQQKCVHFLTSKWTTLLEETQNETVNTDYKSIVITSREKDVGDYNFFERVCGLDGSDGWYGWRVLCCGTFASFCGAVNVLNIGSEKFGGSSPIGVHKEVILLNNAHGFPNIPSLFHPASMLEYFGYHFPDVASLPPAYLKIPFTSRDGPDDIGHEDPLDFITWCDKPSPEWEKPVPLSPAKTVHSRDDDEQSNGYPGSPQPRDAGSSPLGDISNGRKQSPSGPEAGRPIKRRRLTSLVMEEAEAEDDDDEEQVSLPPP